MICRELVAVVEEGLLASSLQPDKVLMSEGFFGIYELLMSGDEPYRKY